MPHASTIFIEIIRLYNLTMGKTSIKKEKLEMAFRTFIKILTEVIDGTIYFDYSEELNKFLSQNSKFFYEDNESIKWDDDIEEIYTDYINHNPLNALDYKTAEFVHNLDMYKVLDIKIPNEDVAPFFNGNLKLMQAFTNVAFNEYQGLPLPLDELEQIREDFLSLFDNMNNATLTKLRVVQTKYDHKYSPGLDYHQFLPWQIILFSASEQEWQLLTYNTIATYCEDFDEILSMEQEELINTYINPEDNSIILNTYEIFLKILIIYLHKFLKSTPNFPGRDSIIAKKYMLLSLPELGNTLEYLFEHQTLDSINIESDRYETTEEEISTIYLECLDCIKLLQKSDKELNNNPNNYASMVLCAIFLKSFLKIASKKFGDDITNILTDPKYYQNSPYKTYTDILNSITFNDNFYLARN